MITVKIFGLLRIGSGIKEKEVAATTVQEVLQLLADCGIPVNGKNAGTRSKPAGGDTVVLMSPVACG